MHNTALQHHNIPASYHALSVRQSEFNRLIAHFNHPMFMGANVTIPYKETLFDAVDTLGVEAAQIGAVNTIVKRNGKIVGENTDAYGFMVPIQKYEDDLAGERAVIFGTGGATKAISFALINTGVEEIVMVSRRPGRYEGNFSGITMCGYENWAAFAEDAMIVVNATPIGMSPNASASPVADEDAAVLEGKICYDIVYNPRDTVFLQQATEYGGYPVGGLDMLIYQGARSFNLWTGKDFPVGLIRKELKDVFPD